MSQQPSGGGHGHPAVDLLSRIVSATDRMRKAREAGQQSEIQAAQQERRRQEKFATHPNGPRSG